MSTESSPRREDRRPKEGHRREGRRREDRAEDREDRRGDRRQERRDWNDKRERRDEREDRDERREERRDKKREREESNSPSPTPPPKKTKKVAERKEMWRPDMSPNAKRKSEIDNRRFKAWKEKKERIKANKEAEQKAILDQQEAKEPWGKTNEKEKEEEEDPDKEKPNFEPSGALLSEFKTKKGVELKYVECPEAKKPTTKWRLYPCKDDKILDPYKIHQHSMYLLGRDRKVVDIPLDHQSCSKQHAVLQYRSVAVTDEEGQPTKVTKPYIIDLNSTNGTFLNGSKIDSERYIELLPRDVLRFGNSTRDFVLLHEGMT